MPPSTQNPETDQLPQVETKRERRGIARFFGHAAVELEQGQQTSLEHFVNSLDKDLRGFEDMWNEGDGLVDRFLASEETRDLMKQTILEYRHDHGATDLIDNRAGVTISHNRIASRFADRDLVEFVGAHVLWARTNESAVISRWAVVNKALDEADSIREARNMANKSLRSRLLALDTAQLRWSEVKDTTCEHTPHAIQFYESLDELRTKTKKYYGRAFDSAEHVVEQTEKYLGRGDKIDQAKVKELLALVDGDSERSVHSTFLKILASDYMNRSENSVLGRCLSYSAETLEKGGMIGRFIKEKFDSKSQSNSLPHISEIVGRYIPGISLDEVMTETMERWQPQMKSEYATFAKSELNKIRAKTNLFAQKYGDRRLAAVDGDSVAVAMEKLLIKLRGPIGNQYRGKATITPRDAIKPQVTQEQDKTYRSIKAISLENGNRTRYQVASDDLLEKMKSEVIKRYPHEQRLTRDLEKILNVLAKEPWGRGTVRVSNAKRITIGGKKTEVNRFNPVERQGLSVTEIGKKIRIVFAATSDDICVIAIKTDHDEYEDFLQTLK